jgi:hypothetical protein
MPRAALAACLVALPGLAAAHPAPNSTLRLEFRATAVHGEYWIPVSELDAARAADPARDHALPDYLVKHLAAESPDGARWRLAIDGVRESTYLDHAYLVVDLRLLPPAGSMPGEFALVDDTVTHEVRNHRLFVVARRGAGAELVGVLQYPARRLEIAARERP